MCYVSFRVGLSHIQIEGRRAANPLDILKFAVKGFGCRGFVTQRFALHWSESQDKYWQRGNEKLETASFKLSPEGTVIAAHCEHQGHCHQQL